MKLDYRFKNCFGNVYTGGNVSFAGGSDSTSTLNSISGHRLVMFDLKHNTCHSKDAVSNHNLSCFDVSPNGLITVAINENGVASVVSNQSGLTIRTFDFRAPVAAVKFSPDGSKIAIAKNDVILIYHAPGTVAVYNPFKLYRLLSGCYGTVLSLNWSFDSKLIAVGCDDATSKVFAADWIKGFSTYSLGSHRSAVIGCFFVDKASADCYTVSRDGAVHSWKCSRKLEEFEIYERGAHLYSLEDEEDEKESKNRSDALAKYPKLEVEFNRSARLRVAVDSSSVDVVACDYHQRTRLMVIGLSDGQFHLYELPDLLNYEVPELVQVQSLSIGSSHPITSVCINGTGDWVAVASENLGQLLVWEWKSESYILKQQSHASRHVVTSAMFSPDEQFVVTGGNDGKVKVWQTKSSFCLVTFSEHSSTVTSVLFTQSGKAVMSASLDGTVRAFDLKRYRNFKTLTSPRPAQFTSLSVDSSGDIVAACAVDLFEIFVWSMKTGAILEILSGHTSAVTSLQFAPITSDLITVSLDGYVRSWNVTSGKGGLEILNIGHEIAAVAVNPNGAEAAISTSKANLQVIDLQQFEIRDILDCRHDLGIGRGTKDQTTAKSLSQSRTFTSLCYSPDGAFLLAGGHSKYVCLYSISQLLLVKKFTVSQNFSIDRMQEMLDRRKMTEFGNMDLVDGDATGDVGKSNESAIPLPGVRNVDLGERSFKAEIKVDQIHFSQSGRSWLAASTEGCVLYSLDSDTLFDPYQLSADISPLSTRKLLTEKRFQLALIYSLKLSDSQLTKEVLESTPVVQIESIVSVLPVVYVFRLANFLTNQILSTHLIEFYILWCKAVLMFHRNSIKELMPKNELTAFNKALMSRYEELRSICEPVEASLNYFLAMGKMRTLKLKNTNDYEHLGDVMSDGEQSERQVQSDEDTSE